MPNLNPITNIYATGTAAAQGKTGKTALEARGAAVHTMNKNLMNTFVFGSAQKSEWCFEQKENHANSALGQYYQKTFKLDLDGDGKTDAWAKSFWDEKGHMYEVQVGKDLSHLQRIDNDTDLEIIDSRFVTSADNKTGAPAAAAPKATAEPAKKEEELTYTHPNSIADIDKLQFAFEAGNYTNFVSGLSKLRLLNLIPKEAATKLDDLENKDLRAHDEYNKKCSQINSNTDNINNNALRKREKLKTAAFQEYEKIAKPLDAQYNRIMRAEVKKLLKAGNIQLSDIDIF